jgi:hypothetical protein
VAFTSGRGEKRHLIPNPDRPRLITITTGDKAPVILSIPPIDILSVSIPREDKAFTLFIK